MIKLSEETLKNLEELAEAASIIDDDEDLTMLLLAYKTGLEENKRLRGILHDHHQWQLNSTPTVFAVPDGHGGWVGMDRAAEYSQSSLFERTEAALKEGGQ